LKRVLFDSDVILTRLLLKLQIASITDSVIRTALASPIADFEDAVTHEAAIAAKVDMLVTRNIADFRNATIPILLPEIFLTIL
jgi:hypothetical protein